MNLFSQHILIIKGFLQYLLFAMQDYLNAVSSSILLLYESVHFRKMGRYIHFTSIKMRLNHLHKFK